MRKDKGRATKAKNLKQQNKDAIGDIDARLKIVENAHKGEQGQIVGNFQYLLTSMRGLEKIHTELTHKYNGLVSHHNYRAKADKAFFEACKLITAKVPTYEDYSAFVDKFIKDAMKKEMQDAKDEQTKKITEIRKQSGEPATCSDCGDHFVMGARKDGSVSGVCEKCGKVYSMTFEEREKKWEEESKQKD